jgi:branched-chain amino acid transport system substrate-binding protein
MKASKTLFAVLGLALLAVFAETGCTKKAAVSTDHAAPTGDELLVGEVGSMTGSEATFGISTHQGIVLAFEQINAAGGVKGKKFKLTSLDDQGKPDEAATAATKLITQDKIIALLGEVASSRSIAMAPIAQSHGVPMITPSSTNPKVTEQGDYIFRACFIDPFQGTVMAKFAANDLKIKNVAVLRDVKNDYSVGLAAFFTETFTKMGGTVVVDQSYSSGDTDFKSQLTAIRAKKPDAIYVPGYYTEVGLIARQARELGITVPLMGGDGWDSPKLTEIGQKWIEGSFFSSHYSQDDKAPAVQKFIADYKTKWNSVPDAMAAMGYDAAKLLADAMTRAPDLTNTAIKNAIATTKDYQAVTGLITLNEHRDPIKSAVVLKVADGHFKYQTTVKP